MYTEKNYKTKKPLREAIAAGAQVRIYQPNDIFGNPKGARDYSGTAALEGPHYPEPHRWYATATLVNGLVTKVK
jgi:hypothetical protein